MPSLIYKTMSFSVFILLFLFTSETIPQIASLEATLKTRKINQITIAFQNGMPLPTFEKQQRQIISLHGNWKKQRFSADDNITLAKRDETGYNNLITEAANRHTPSYDDTNWDNKNIPSVENQMRNYPLVPEYYQDGVWYRYKFNSASDLNGKFIKLIFYSVNYVADVWLNGNYLGYHEGGYTPFAFDVSSHLNYGGENVLAVRVDNPAWGSRNDIVPFAAVDWFNYTGIIHDVYLEVSDPVSVIRTNVVPTDINGTLETTVVLYNRSSSDKTVDVSIEVLNANVNDNNIRSEFVKDLAGSPASFSGNSQMQVSIQKDSAAVWRTILNVQNPRLWSPKFPELYVLKVTVRENGNVTDEYYTQFGIRTVKQAGDKVLLNNSPVFLTGVARHEDHPVYGRSIPVDTIYTDLLKVKSVNANMLRTGHYPNHLQTYLLADRLGMVVLEEIPVWWFDTALVWAIQNSIRRIHEQMFKEMVFRDYNRPSILLWSTCNECADVPNRKTFIQRVKQDLQNNYNDGRLITQSAAADRPGPEDDSQNACDVMGWTMYFGIFHGSTYYEGTKYFLVDANIAHPNKPILDTEFGYWSGESGTGQGTQVTVFNETFRALKFRSPVNPDGTLNCGGFLMGVTWWCIFDWYTHQLPNGFQSMGLFNMQRTSIKQVGNTLKVSYLPYYELGGTITGVESELHSDVPSEFSLEQNYPNPFNPSTFITFNISQPGNVTLKIYDMLGREAAMLVNESLNSGKHIVEFNSADYPALSSGVYIYTITSGDRVESRKMVLLK